MTLDKASGRAEERIEEKCLKSFQVNCSRESRWWQKLDNDNDDDDDVECKVMASLK